MAQTTIRAVLAGLGRLGSSLADRPVVLMLYYLAVLCGLALLYGRGDVTTTTGFIYQAF